MLGKLNVNGVNASPLYEWLKSEKSSITGKSIKWNFVKFLVGRDGRVKGRWGSTRKPESLKEPIVKELREGEKEN
jgi:peroxiredoxin